MLSVSSGYSSKYLTDAVAVGRENYYTGAVAAGEPPGRWYGRGAEHLGLSGTVDAQDMTALFEHFIDPRDEAFADPTQWGDAGRLGHGGRQYKTAKDLFSAAVAVEPDASPERRDELWADAAKRARSNVAFFDATFSVQKSVTVLHTAFEAQETAARNSGDSETAEAWAEHRRAVEDAIWAGNRAAIDYLADRAGYTRVGHHGGAAGRFVDAHDFVVASFFQHDNRNHDPQLHIHNAILNRVQGSDGAWRTLDGKALFLHRPAAAAVGERVMEEHLTRALGVRFETRPDGRSREVVGIPQPVLDLFSSRRRAITQMTQHLVADFRRVQGRDPNSLELDRLQRQSTLATRKAKTHEGETSEQRLRRWDAELRAEISGGLQRVAHDVLAISGKEPDVVEWSPAVVLDTALAEVQATKSGWTRADLVRAISNNLPGYLGGLDPDQVRTLVEGLADEGITCHAVELTADGPASESLPEELRLADGTSAYERPGERRYATADHLTAERALRDAAVARGAPALTPQSARRVVEGWAEHGIELGADQAHAVTGVLTSGARVESLVGPAGTGKSFVVGALAQAWQDPELWGGQAHRVVGLATSQIATQVLADEGLTARNITQWLATQNRLRDANSAGGSLSREDLAWRLGDGDLVVVDESAMTTTTDLTAIRAHVDAAGAKLLLVGDHRQLAAVGAGGGMALVADAGQAYELTEARRFTHGWEAAASLRLREGDPTVLGEYRKHGRIIDGGTVEETETAAVRAYLADTLAGRRSLLVTGTNEQADRAAAAVRAELVRLGRVSEAGVMLPRQGTTAGVGDVIQARRNGWHLAGYDGNTTVPVNRQTYRVVATRPDGGLDVAPVTGSGQDDEQVGGTLVLPAAYVAEHVTLGYAATAHAAQGVTVDTAHTLAGPGTNARGLYVGLSRGREANTVYVTTRAVAEDAPTGAVAEVEARDPQAVLDDLITPDTDPLADSADLAAVTAAETSHQHAGSLQTIGERFADVADLATAGRAAAFVDQLLADGHIDEAQRRDLAHDDHIGALSRVLRQAELAGHHPYQVLTDAVTARPLTGSRNLASVVHHRITSSVDLDPTGDSYTDWIPTVDHPAYTHHLEQLAAAADARTRHLGEYVAETLPAWAIENLGPPPPADTDTEDVADADVDVAGEGGSDGTEEDARTAWVRRAGVVAAHRELAGWDDDTDALPAPPKAGQVEARASWRAAWRALGRSDEARDEVELSDGQLRMRVRAWDRERAWEPTYVAHALSGTRQAEARHRATAHLRHAAAQTAGDPDERARLEAEATEAAALADALADQATQLEDADSVRARWYAHTAHTRTAAERAKLELTNRGVDLTPDDTTTAEEWLAAHAEADAIEDEHRPITQPDDLTDEATTRDQAAATIHATATTEGEAVPVVDHQPDIRVASHGEAEDEARSAVPETPDWTRVPTAAETADAVARAQHALAELQARADAEAARETDEDRGHDIAWRHDTDPHPDRDTTTSRDASRATDRAAGQEVAPARSSLGLSA